MIARTMAAWALAYADRDWPVLPLHHPVEEGCSCAQAVCTSIGKHPRTAHGLTDATSDTAIITEWWERWPKANIGLATGVAFDALDIDSADAWDRFETAGIAHEPWDLTGAVVETGRGCHVYVSPTGEGNRAGLWKGVDWRGRGGYVVAAPSLHASGHRYALTLDVHPGPAPAWLLDRLRRRRKALVHTAEASVGTAYGAKALDGECGRLAIAGEGTRNNELNRASFRLGQLVASGDLDRSTVADRLLIVAERIGLTQSEAITTVRSGMAAGLATPRREAAA